MSKAKEQPSVRMEKISDPTMRKGGGQTSPAHAPQPVKVSSPPKPPKK
jgi:hypothetical protein